MCTSSEFSLWNCAVRKISKGLTNIAAQDEIKQNANPIVRGSWPKAPPNLVASKAQRSHSRLLLWLKTPLFWCLVCGSQPTFDSRLTNNPVLGGGWPFLIPGWGTVSKRYPIVSEKHQFGSLLFNRVLGPWKCDYNDKNDIFQNTPEPIRSFSYFKPVHPESDTYTRLQCLQYKFPMSISSEWISAAAYQPAARYNRSKIPQFGISISTTISNL